MRRREFIQTVVLSTALPLMASAQQITPSSRIVKIGVLWQLDSADDLLKIYGDVLTSTLRGLGYVDGKTAQFLHRSANEPLRLRELSKELVDQAPDVIIASSQLAAIEIKRATTTIPIVFATSPNPVGSGLVESLAHPGGNPLDHMAAYVHASPPKEYKHTVQSPNGPMQIVLSKIRDFPP
jgi:putative ABC transport system substrate-binding protein